MSDPASLPDEALVERLKEAAQGDVRGFETLVNRHRQKVLANCRYLTRSSHEAEDLAQEVFVKAFFAMGGFEERSTFRTWLQRIKINHCLNHLKKHQGKTFVDVEDPQVAASEELAVAPMVERRVESVRSRERIRGVLDAMSDTLRLPLIMRDMDGLSYQEIAEVLGIGLSAVKMRIKRARETFRVLYDRALEPSSRGAAEES